MIIPMLAVVKLYTIVIVENYSKANITVASCVHYYIRINDLVDVAHTLLTFPDDNTRSERERSRRLSEAIPVSQVEMLYIRHDPTLLTFELSFSMFT